MTIHVVKGADGFDRSAFNAEDVRRMTEAGILGLADPFELVDGELIEIAAEGYPHDRAKMALAGELFATLDRRDFYIAIECTLRLDPLTLLEPDLLVCRQDRVGRSMEGYVEIGGPEVLLLIEVADPSLRYDKMRKAPLYAAHNFQEYWIADLNAARIIVHRDPGPLGYGHVRPVPQTETVTPLAAELAGISIWLDDLV